jgi:chromate transporter
MGLRAIVVAIIAYSADWAQIRTIVDQNEFSLMKIGPVAFGGGYIMIPLNQAEVVSKYNWLTTHEFIDGIAMGR